MEDLFDEAFRGFGFPRFRRLRPALETRGWAPSVDMLDKPDEIVVRAELPGVVKEDIDISVTEDVLTLQGETKKEKAKGTKIQIE